VLEFIARRLLNLVPIFFGATLIAFFIIHTAPGDCLEERRANPKTRTLQIEQLEKEFGLNDPPLVQYGLWVKNLVTGNLGVSCTFEKPVLEVIRTPIANSMILVIGNVILLYLLAIPLGVYGAIRQYSVGDQVSSIISYFFLGFPSFFLGLLIIFGLLQFKFATGAELLPVAKMTSENHLQLSPIMQFFDILRHAIAPIVVVTIIGVASTSRFMRAQMLEFLNQDYIRTARAKGLPERTVIYKHALRNAVTPFIAGIGGLLPDLVSGAGFVEVIFDWPGITPVSLAALTAKDTWLMTGFIAITLVLLIIGNLLSDLLLAVVDPRVRYT
jgi:peptide/nickel transport system permease protein